MAHMGHTIDVMITEDGEIKATVQGIQGSACADISKFLDQLGKVVEDKKTPDFYQATQAVGGIQTKTW